MCGAGASAMRFKAPACFPHLNVHDNITLLAKLSRLDAAFIEQRYGSLMDAMGLVRGIGRCDSRICCRAANSNEWDCAAR